VNEDKQVSFGEQIEELWAELNTLNILLDEGYIDSEGMLKDGVT